MMKQLIVRQVWLLMIAAIVSGSVGWHAHKWYAHHYEIHKLRHIVSKDYQFTSPLLDVELPEGINIYNEPEPFKYKIEAFIKNKIDQGQVKMASVYFRDLLDGPWFGINLEVEFNAASMMKVPVMVSWLKRAEKDPDTLKRRLKYEEPKNPLPGQYTRPAQTLTSGQSYSIDELLHYMMNYSDNKATLLLYESLDQKELGEVLDNMDIKNLANAEGNYLTVHGFSGFFRILYNASYLNREMSEKALQLLSLDDFPLGIAAGVPKGIKVSAKFGEIVPESRNEDIQLHEFGIVYHPKHHYILGVMTRGHDFTAQAAIIRDISRMIYSYVDSNARK